MNEFYIKDENNIPQELIEAKNNGKTIQCLTVVGYVDIDEPEFRVGVNYKIKDDA